MRVTKYVHSCLLVETDDRVILIDPGSYTYQSHLLKPPALNKLDYVVITHEHPDHYSPELLHEFSAKFPHATVITNNDLAAKLAEQKLSNQIISGSQEGLEVFSVDHEPLAWGLPTVPNIGVHIDNFLTDPGDSLNLQSSRDVLALPLTAPFASVKQALEAIVKLKPKKVLPLHDWPWQKSARQEYYARTKSYLAEKGIEFIELENAVPVEI